MQYDEQAESLIADLEFKEDDSPQEVQLKFQLLENYSKRLSERYKRMDFTLQYRILDIDYRFEKEIVEDSYQK